MKSNFLLGALATIFIFGCEKTIVGKSWQSNPRERERIAQMCEQLSKVGDVGTIIQTINRQMALIEDLLKQGLSTTEAQEIRAHSVQIKNSAKKLISILDSEYTEISYSQQLEWRIDPEDFPFSNGVLSLNYQPAEVQIQKAFTWNGEDPELSKEFAISWGGRQGIVVSFARPASLVELCQLEKMTNLVLRVLYISDVADPIEKYYRLKLKGNE